MKAVETRAAGIEEKVNKGTEIMLKIWKRMEGE